jgi:hypothetical protein
MHRKPTSGRGKRSVHCRVGGELADHNPECGCLRSRKGNVAAFQHNTLGEGPNEYGKLIFDDPSNLSLLPRRGRVRIMLHGQGGVVVTLDQIPATMTLHKAMPVAMRYIDHRIGRAPIDKVAAQPSDASILECFIDGPLIDQEVIPRNFVQKRCVAAAAKARVPQRYRCLFL